MIDLDAIAIAVSWGVLVAVFAAVFLRLKP
jgi:hypothetical protein